MSYEYKDAAKNALIMVYSLVQFPKEEVLRAQNELDHVYAQAAKAVEYEAKAEAYDDIRYAMEMQTAVGVSDEDTLIDIDHVIMSLIKRMEGGEFDD